VRHVCPIANHYQPNAHDYAHVIPLQSLALQKNKKSRIYLQRLLKIEVASLFFSATLMLRPLFDPATEKMSSA
jgi:hypothetical protein